MHGLDTWVILDTGAVPDILSLKFTETTKGVTASKFQICAAVGIFQVQISFQYRSLRLKLLVVKDSPFYLILVIPTIEHRLRSVLDYDQILFNMTINGSNVELPLDQYIFTHVVEHH